MGSLDCLTTVVGSLYFGTQELNPLISGLVSSNILAFVAVKLAVTMSVGLIFIFTEKTLLRTEDKNCRSFRFAQNTLRVAYYSIVLFLAVVVVNNILVLVKIAL
jgi:hypothetical protein